MVSNLHYKLTTLQFYFTSLVIKMGVVQSDLQGYDWKCKKLHIKHLIVGLIILLYCYNHGLVQTMNS